MPTRAELKQSRLEKQLADCQAKQVKLVQAGYTGTDLAACVICGALYYRHPMFSRSDYCCACRIQHRINQVMGYSGTKTEALPGFPKVEQFQTLAQLDDYFAEEKLQCLICGHAFAGLSQHINHQHAMSSREYQLAYGIPFGRGLVGCVTSEKISEATTERMEAMGPEAVMAQMENAQSLNFERGCKPSHAPAITAMRRLIALEKMVDSPNHISRTARLEMVDVPCSVCQAPTRVNGMVAITTACRLLCKDCRRRRISAVSLASKHKRLDYYQQYQREWKRKNKAKKGSPT